MSVDLLKKNNMGNLTGYKKEIFNQLPLKKRLEVMTVAVSQKYNDVLKVVRAKKNRYGYEGYYEMKKNAYDPRDSKYSPFNIYDFELFVDGK
jgi:hypothetical protein